MNKEKVLERLRTEVFIPENIMDIETFGVYLQFQTPLELMGGGHDWGIDDKMPLKMIEKLAFEENLIFSISGTGDSDTPNRLKIALWDK